MKDFGIIFNAYTRFEEEMITALGSDEIQHYAEVGPNDNVDYEIESRMKKLEVLIDRQPFILSKINVKRAPNDVRAWISYADLYLAKDDFENGLLVINEGLETISPSDAENGLLSLLWIKLASLYQEADSIRQAN